MADDDRRGRPLILGDHPFLRVVLIASVLVLAVGAAVQMLSQAGVLLSAVLVPVALAILLTGLLMPLQVVLNHKLKLPRSLAGAVTLVVALGAVVGLLWVSGSQLASGTDDIVDVFQEQLERLREWVLTSSPLGKDQLNEAISQFQAWIESNQATLAQGVLGAGAGAAGLMVSAVLALVATFFFLSQGDRIWAGLLMLLPPRWRRPLFEASRRGWVTLGTYCRTQLVVGAVDAAGFGLGALILDVPFVVPLVAITFILCFIPYVGAILSSTLAVVVAFAFQGPTTALIMLGICILVLQLEGNVLSPVLMGKAVNVHPLLILLSVAAATYVLGLVGALFMVPVLATIKSMVVYLNGADPFPGLAQGGRALTDSPRKLIGDREPIKNPPRIGDATPVWLRQELAEEEKAAEEEQLAEQARIAEEERILEEAEIEQTEDETPPNGETSPNGEISPEDAPPTAGP